MKTEDMYSILTEYVLTKNILDYIWDKIEIYNSEGNTVNEVTWRDKNHFLESSIKRLKNKRPYSRESRTKLPDGSILRTFRTTSLYAIRDWEFNIVEKDNAIISITHNEPKYIEAVSKRAEFCSKHKEQVSFTRTGVKVTYI